MSLFEAHKSERRARIVAAARELVTKHGYDGLTMRDLAAAARVSVPTLYNLFGSKDAILVSELERTTTVIASRILQSANESFFERGMAAFDAGMDLIAEQPEFFRAVMQMFLTSPESAPARLRAEHGYIAIMAANLRAAKQAGQLAEWADPEIVGSHMYGLYISCFLAWCAGELDMPSFRTAALSGICHLLIGVARGPFAAAVEARLKKLTKESAFLKSKAKELRHASKSRSNH
jgi:AcrR family transcriptional regulator